MRERKTDGTYAVEHGMTGTRLYHIWCSMNQRCYTPGHNRYQRYGGRGIKVCEEWKRFIPFMEWAMANGYEDGLTLDRIENDGNYEPSNCKWSTYKQQNHNNSRNIWININGEVKCLAEWSELFGVKYATAYLRFKKGFLPEEIFDKNDRRQKR